MAILVSLNGNSAGDGFLLAPLDSVYWAELSLATDAGTATVSLLASPDAAGLVFDNAGPHNLSTVPITVKVHATLQSVTRGDTVIRIMDGATELANFPITSIENPSINFKGRFEVRFATQPALYNQNPKYTSANEDVSPGWTWILEGEPDFVPGSGNVPENLEMTGMGRVIRLNNPVSLRSHVPSVTSTVYSISGETGSGTETFLTGDALIGLPVNFGAHTYFAGNREWNPPQPEEYYSDAFEPMGLFEVRFGNPSLYFRGASQVSSYVAKATSIDQQTRVTDSRPIATGLVGASSELSEFGLPTLVTYSETRIDLLMADYAALPAGPSMQRRNLVRRINHLLPRVSAAKRTSITSANPGVFSTTKPGTIPAGWSSKEVFIGRVDTDLHAMAGASSVVEYFRQFYSFHFEWHPFGFHSDELCGHHKGSLRGDVTMTGNHIGDPHTRTVNGVNYDFQSVGEFTLLRKGTRMEIQVRQSPVATANPITDGYSGLTAHVSLNTAVAAKVGSHKISLQPSRRLKGRLQFYLDGKPADFPTGGLNLDDNHVTTFNADGEQGIRIDYKDNTVVLITPAFWNAHNVSYINVSISNTTAHEGIMGYIPKGSWLPRLRDGKDLGPKPSSLHDRYVALYKTFADSWRVSKSTSLFYYDEGTSTETFTDLNWPAEKPPYEIKPELNFIGMPLQGMTVDQAKQICQGVTEDDLHNHCVFDVATTGDEFFAKGYLFAQELRRKGTLVKIFGHETPVQVERDQDIDPAKLKPKSILIQATVSSITSNTSKPKGSITFYVDNKPVSDKVQLDVRGRASWRVSDLDKGSYLVTALFTPADNSFHESWSPNLNITLHESTIVKGGGGGDTGGNSKGSAGGRWYIWVILILILLLIVCLLTRH
jgi:hypothetical protein